MSSSMPPVKGAPASRVSRRVIARGAAWTVPVVAVASAAPAMAATACASFTAAESYATNQSDTVTLTNNSTVEIPAGTTITWQFQNVASSTQTISIANLSGVTVTPSRASPSIATSPRR